MDLLLKKKHKILLSALKNYLAESDDFIFVKDENLVYVASSLPFARLVGYKNPNVESVAGKTDYDLFEDKELARRYVNDDRRMIELNAPLRSYIEPIPTKDGKQHYARTRKSPIYSRRGKIIGVYGTGRDITHEYEVQLNYERERRYLMELPAQAYWAVLVDVTDWKLAEVKNGAAGAYGVPPHTEVDAFAGFVAESITEGESARRFFTSFTRERVEQILIEGIRSLVYEYKRIMEDGEEHWVREEIRMLINPQSLHSEMLFTLFDIDEQMRERDQLMHLAEHDSMTGLLNHETTVERVSEYLTGEGADGTHALFMIDIDNFKSINDTYGHQCGDDAIVGVAAVISGEFRASDIVGRVGGDEFLVLMKNVDKYYAAEPKALCLVELMSRLKAGDTQLSGSIGIAMYNGGGKTFDSLYAEADAALYRAKQSGRNRYDIAGREDAKTEASK